jgi:hypothetical protein
MARTERNPLQSAGALMGPANFCRAWRDATRPRSRRARWRSRVTRTSHLPRHDLGAPGLWLSGDCCFEASASSTPYASKRRSSGPITIAFIINQTFILRRPTNRRPSQEYRMLNGSVRCFLFTLTRVRVFLAFNLKKHGSRSPPQVVPPVSPVPRDRARSTGSHARGKCGDYVNVGSDVSRFANAVANR